MRLRKVIDSHLNVVGCRFVHVMSASNIKHLFPFKQNASTANSSLRVCQEKFCKLELIGLKLLKGVIGQGLATLVLEGPMSCRFQLQP